MQPIVLLLLLVLYGSAFEMHETPRLVGNLDHDGSEKQVQKWIDSFHKAARSGDRNQIASHFADKVEIMTCDGGPSRFERIRFNRTTIIDYLVAHGSNVDVKLLESKRHDRRPADKHVHIWTELIVTGIGKPFSPMVNFFVVNDTLLYFGGEMTYCGYGRPSESVGDGSMSVAYDFLASFARAMRNRTHTFEIAEHFSKEWNIKDCNRRCECTKIAKRDVFFAGYSAQDSSNAGYFPFGDKFYGLIVDFAISGFRQPRDINTLTTLPCAARESMVNLLDRFRKEYKDKMKTTIKEVAEALKDHLLRLSFEEDGSYSEPLDFSDSSPPHANYTCLKLQPILLIHC